MSVTAGSCWPRSLRIPATWRSEGATGPGEPMWRNISAPPRGARECEPALSVLGRLLKLHREEREGGGRLAASWAFGAVKATFGVAHGGNELASAVEVVAEHCAPRGPGERVGKQGMGRGLRHE